MPKTFLFAVLIVLSVSCLCATAAEIHVAPDGNDANDGSKAKPLASVTAARDAVRKLVAAGLTEDVKVLIAPGRYYLPQGLVLGPQDSGSEKFSITYAGVGEKAPVLIGGRKVTGFNNMPDAIQVMPPLPQAAGNNVYKGSLGGATKSLVAQEDGVRLTLAREPNTGYARASGGRGTSISYGGDTYKMLAGGKFPDAVVAVWPDWGWDCRVTGLASAGVGQVALTKDVGTIKRNNRFYVMNAVPLLDSPGECVMDTTSGRMYVWPTKGTAEGKLYEIATADNVVLIKGGKDKPVRNVHFANLDMMLANADGVFIADAQDCSIRGCLIENTWERGVWVKGVNRGVMIADCEIRNVGRDCVGLTGEGMTATEVSTANVVENCHLHHGGVIFTQGAGVQIYFSGHNRVEHNHIHDFARYAVSVKAFSTRKTKRRDYDKLHARNNTIAYNHMHHVCQDSDDCGAIESWGPGKSNVYDHNLIHDSGAGGLQFGIYLDDATDDSTVSNNVIYGVKGGRFSAVICAKGIGNRIVNNVLVSAGVQAVLRSKASVSSHDQVITHNIFYIDAGSAVFDLYDWNSNRFKTCDNNVYFNPKGGLRNIGKGPGFGAVKGANSIEADPLFTDAAARDYSLKSDSPALKIGIKSIDLRNVGLTEKFPKRLARQ
ncbi:MAG: right-handed parallel beta-helix repeat-containing protein [Planctomycetaceae bacterium]|nr:right-handed parallel beta-helix repeat-containing protein [Planctomycetaceae bacterium]